MRRIVTLRYRLLALGLILILGLPPQVFALRQNQDPAAQAVEAALRPGAKSGAEETTQPAAVATSSGNGVTPAWTVRQLRALQDDVSQDQDPIGLAIGRAPDQVEMQDVKGLIPGWNVQLRGGLYVWDAPHKAFVQLPNHGTTPTNRGESTEQLEQGLIRWLNADPQNRQPSTGSPAVDACARYLATLPLPWDWQDSWARPVAAHWLHYKLHLFEEGHKRGGWALMNALLAARGLGPVNPRLADEAWMRTYRLALGEPSPLMLLGFIQNAVATPTTAQPAGQEELEPDIAAVVAAAKAGDIPKAVRHLERALKERTIGPQREFLGELRDQTGGLVLAQILAELAPPALDAVLVSGYPFVAHRVLPIVQDRELAERLFRNASGWWTYQQGRRSVEATIPFAVLPQAARAQFLQARGDPPGIVEWTLQALREQLVREAEDGYGRLQALVQLRDRPALFVNDHDLLYPVFKAMQAQGRLPRRGTTLVLWDQEGHDDGTRKRAIDEFAEMLRRGGVLQEFVARSHSVTPREWWELREEWLTEGNFLKALAVDGSVSEFLHVVPSAEEIRHPEEQCLVPDGDGVTRVRIRKVHPAELPALLVALRRDAEARHQPFQFVETMDLDHFLFDGTVDAFRDAQNRMAQEGLHPVSPAILAGSSPNYVPARLVPALLDQVANALQPMAFLAGLEEQTPDSFGPVSPAEELKKRQDRFRAGFLATQTLGHRGTGADLDLALGFIDAKLSSLARATQLDLAFVQEESQQAINLFHDVRAEAGRQWEAQAAPEPIPVSVDRSLAVLMTRLVRALDNLDNLLISGTSYPPELRKTINQLSPDRRDASQQYLASLGEALTRSREFLRDRIALASGQSPDGAVASFADIRDQLSLRYGARLVIEIPPDVDTAQVAMTPVRLFSLISNLVDDAVKHGPADAPVRVRCASTSAGELAITVSDRGAGIPADYFSPTTEGMIRLFTLEGREGRIPLGLAEVWDTVGIAGGRLAVETLRKEKYEKLYFPSIRFTDFTTGEIAVLQEFRPVIAKHFERYLAAINVVEANEHWSSAEYARFKEDIGNPYLVDHIRETLQAEGRYNPPDLRALRHVAGNLLGPVGGWLEDIAQEDLSQRDKARARQSVVAWKDVVRGALEFLSRLAEGRRTEPGTTFTIWLPLAKAGLEEPAGAGTADAVWVEQTVLAPLERAVAAWQAGGLLGREPVRAEVWLNTLRRAAAKANNTVDPNRRADRRACLQAFGVLMGQLVDRDTAPSITIRRIDGRQALAAHVQFTMEGTAYTAQITGRVRVAPLLTATIYRGGTMLGMLRFGYDRVLRRHQREPARVPRLPHLDVADSNAAGARTWAHHWLLTRVWHNPAEAVSFIRGLFNTYLQAGQEEPGAGDEEVTAHRAVALAQARAVGQALRDGPIGQALRQLADAIEPQRAAEPGKFPFTEWTARMRPLQENAEAMREQLGNTPGYVAETLHETLTHELSRGMSHLLLQLTMVSDEDKEKITDLDPLQESSVRMLRVFEELATLRQWREWYVAAREDHEMIAAQDRHGLVLGTRPPERPEYLLAEQLEQAISACAPRRGGAPDRPMGWIVPYQVAKEAGLDRVVAALQSTAGALPIAFLAETDLQREGLVLAGIPTAQIYSTTAIAFGALQSRVRGAFVLYDRRLSLDEMVSALRIPGVYQVELRRFLQLLESQLADFGLRVEPAAVETLRDAIRQYASLELQPVPTTRSDAGLEEGVVRTISEAMRIIAVHGRLEAQERRLELGVMSFRRQRQRHIGQAIERVEGPPRPAVIFGAGSLEDIPDALWTSGKFSSWVFVDLVPEITQTALQARIRDLETRGLVTGGIWDNLHLVQADISGVSEGFLDALDEIIDAASSPDEAALLMTQILRDNSDRASSVIDPYVPTDLGRLVLQHGAGLVVSSGVVGDLAGSIEQAIRLRVENKFRLQHSMFDQERKETAFMHYLYQYLSYIEPAHAHLIHQLLHPEGRAYLASILLKAVADRSDQIQDISRDIPGTHPTTVAQLVNELETAARAFARSDETGVPLEEKTKVSHDRGIRGELLNSRHYPWQEWRQLFTIPETYLLAFPEGEEGGFEVKQISQSLILQPRQLQPLASDAGLEELRATLPRPPVAMALPGGTAVSARPPAVAGETPPSEAWLDGLRRAIEFWTEDGSPWLGHAADPYVLLEVFDRVMKIDRYTPPRYPNVPADWLERRTRLLRVLSALMGRLAVPTSRLPNSITYRDTGGEFNVVDLDWAFDGTRYEVRFKRYRNAITFPRLLIEILEGPPGAARMLGMLRIGIDPRNTYGIHLDIADSAAHNSRTEWVHHQYQNELLKIWPHPPAMGQFVNGFMGHLRSVTSRQAELEEEALRRTRAVGRQLLSSSFRDPTLLDGPLGQVAALLANGENRHWPNLLQWALHDSVIASVDRILAELDGASSHSAHLLAETLRRELRAFLELEKVFPKGSDPQAVEPATLEKARTVARRTLDVLEELRGLTQWRELFLGVDAKGGIRTALALQAGIHQRTRRATKRLDSLENQLRELRNHHKRHAPHVGWIVTYGAAQQMGLGRLVAELTRKERYVTRAPPPMPVVCLVGNDEEQDALELAGIPPEQIVQQTGAQVAEALERAFRALQEHHQAVERAVFVSINNPTFGERQLPEQIQPVSVHVFVDAFEQWLHAAGMSARPSTEGALKEAIRRYAGLEQSA